MNLRPRDMAEIKSYSNPPGGVLGVMTAVFYILGDDHIEVRLFYLNQYESFLTKNVVH